MSNRFRISADAPSGVWGRVGLLVAFALVASAVPAAGQTGFERAIEALQRRVVRLYGLRAGLSAGYGSGVLISGDGLVVTVNALILDSRNLRAVTPDGTAYQAEVLGRDDERELALLRLQPAPQYDVRGRRIEPEAIDPSTFDYFEPGDSYALLPGEWVIAGGNPFKVAEGAEPISTTVGVFSTRAELDARRKTRPFPYHGEVLVIDCITSNPGSPGGALVDLDGHWVGLIGRVVVSNRTHTNLNYAMPVEDVMAFVESVLHPPDEPDATGDERSGIAYHGIKLFELGYRKRLVYVDDVRRGSPAEAAGLRTDDLIVSVDGRSVEDIKTFERIMRDKSPGDSVELAVIRDEDLTGVTLVLEEAPP